MANNPPEFACNGEQKKQGLHIEIDVQALFGSVFKCERNGR